MYCLLCVFYFPTDPAYALVHLCGPLLNLLFFSEPILTRGSTDCVMWEDKWTTVTADGGVCAQFKHTVLITRSGAETLTKC